MSAHSAGVSVSATVPEMTTDTAMVIANCRYITPLRPPRKPTGMNTAESTSTIAMTGPATSSMAWIAALFGGSRSEEHTSELQSLMRISYAVFCLKKKPNTVKKQLHSHNNKAHQITIHNHIKNHLTINL